MQKINATDIKINFEYNLNTEQIEDLKLNNDNQEIEKLIFESPVKIKFYEKLKFIKNMPIENKTLAEIEKNLAELKDEKDTVFKKEKFTDEEIKIIDNSIKQIELAVKKYKSQQLSIVPEKATETSIPKAEPKSKEGKIKLLQDKIILLNKLLAIQQAKKETEKTLENINLLQGKLIILNNLLVIQKNKK